MSVDRGHATRFDAISMAADRVRPGPTERFIQAQLVVWIFVLLGLLLMWNGAGR